MKGGILDRYLMREAAGAWAAATFVLLTIMISTRFASVLNFAAKGEIPRGLLFQVVLLSSLRYLVILIPATLLLAIMVSLGRLYSDNEIAAMTGCGVGMGRLYRPFLWLAAALAVFTAALAFEVGPWAGREADYRVKSAKQLVQFSPFEAGQFTTIGGGKATFYTSTMSDAGDKLGEVFARIEETDGASIVVANRGEQVTDPASGEREVDLFDGYRYFGTPGSPKYDVVKFRELKLRLAAPPFNYVNNQRKLESMGELIGSHDLQDQAEVAGRIAAPISVLVLALLAVPLSHLGPREGRYGKLVLGIGVYLVYANLISFGQAWIGQGKLSPELGVWWVHALMLMLAGSLIARRQGWLQ
jgi:lipopolysaccharide export system permease protein